MSEGEMVRDGGAEPEVVEFARRRRFSARYKLRILEEADACGEPGEVGALLRREGLYSSNLVRWRRARDRGELDKPRWQEWKTEGGFSLQEEVDGLRREKGRLEDRLAKAEAIIEVQKKLSELLGVTLERDERR